jgi:aminoglycoside phosphotransferase (APT) family kinase protein
MSDGTRVTGVLDWINARAGDPRADLARTITILRLDGCPPGLRTLPPCAVLRHFERGWRAAYTRAASWPADLAPFYAWAGAVMERDLAGKRTPEVFGRVRAWTRRWQARATVSG